MPIEKIALHCTAIGSRTRECMAVDDKTDDLLVSNLVVLPTLQSIGNLDKRVFQIRPLEFEDHIDVTVVTDDEIRAPASRSPEIALVILDLA